MEKEKGKTKEHSREEYVYLSKLYEKAERFDDMIRVIDKIIEMDPHLSKEERNILSVAYKSILSDKRDSWRILSIMEKGEGKKNPSQVANIKEIKSHIESEILKIFENINNKIDKFLLPNAEDPESKVFYLRMKGDQYRYLCEITKEKDFEKNIENAEKEYKKAFKIAEKGLPTINSVRIGLCLNLALFYYEIKGDKKQGYNIAKNAFKESMKCLDNEKCKTKDVLILIQLLKENLIFWNTEMNEEEQN